MGGGLITDGGGGSQHQTSSHPEPGPHSPASLRTPKGHTSDPTSTGASGSVSGPTKGRPPMVGVPHTDRMVRRGPADSASKRRKSRRLPRAVGRPSRRTEKAGLQAASTANLRAVPGK